MAVKACSPYAPPRFVERADAAGEWFGKAVREAEESGLFTKPRQGWNAETLMNMARDFEEILPFNFTQLQAWMEQKGALKTVKDKETGEILTRAAMTNDPERLGYYNALLKVYLEGSAGGVKQLADNFLMKVKAREDATVEGLEFAQQMQTLSRFGGYVLGWDQSLGRGLAQQGMTNAAGRSSGAAFEAMQQGVRDPAELLKLQEEFGSQFQLIAAMLNDPERAQEGVHELIGLAKRVQFMDDPHLIANYALGKEVAGNAWRELYINGLLSSPTTLVTNAMGVTWAVARPLLQLGTSSLYQALDLPGSKAAQLAAAEASASLASMYSSINDALKIGWHAFRTETALYSNSFKAISGERLAEGLATAGRPAPSQWLYDSVDALGRAVRLPSRAMLGLDEITKHITFRGQVAANGVRNAAKAGVDITNPALMRDAIRIELDKAYKINPADLMEAGDKGGISKLKASLEMYSAGATAYGKSPALTANEVTFQEANSFAEGVSELVNKVPGLRVFIPFIRTPANILKQGIWESTGMAAVHRGASIAGKNLFNPTGMVLDLQRELLADPAETFRIAGQIGLTTVLSGWIYSQVMQGRVTGGGPGRWTAGQEGRSAQNAWTAAGNVPYSIKVGDQWVPFDRFGEPLAIGMRMVADLGMYSAWMTEDDRDEAMAGIAGILASGLYQASFLQGIETLVKVGQKDSGAALGEAAQNWVAAQTPFGGMLAYIDRVQDPYKAAYQGATLAEVMAVHEDAFGTGIFAKVANRIPGIGSTPQLVDQLTGKPVPIVPGIGPGGLNPLQMAIPLFPRNSQADAVWQAVFDISGNYTERRPSDVKLTAREQQQLNGYMANSRVNGQTLAQRIMAFRRRADVQQYVANKGAAVSRTKFKIESELDSIIREHYEQAKLQLFESDAGVMQRLRIATTRDMAAEMNDVSEAKRLNSELDALYQRARRGF